MDENNLMKFVDITHAIECTFEDERSFLAEALERAVASCVMKAAKYGDKSVMTLKITFEPKEERMIVAATLSAKLPEAGAWPITAFVDRAGRLCLDDPRQTTLPISIVAKEQA